VKVLHLGYIGAVSLQGVIKRGEPAQRGGDDPTRFQRLDTKVRGLIELSTGELCALSRHLAATTRASLDQPSENDREP
jgi:hypothetical protein